MMKKILTTFIVISGMHATYSQSTYLVYFKDKTNSTFDISKPSKFLTDRSIQRRIKENVVLSERDLPVSQSYLEELNQAGFRYRYPSKWLNAALVVSPDSLLVKLKSLPFVQKIDSDIPIDSKKPTASKEISKETKERHLSLSLDYGTSLNQIQMLGVDSLQANGHFGKGVLVAVLDAGFLNANANLPFFKQLFDDNRVLKTWDFVDNSPNVYINNSHGTSVLSCMSGFQEGKIIGTAPQADYLLYRTEEVSQERLIEEYYWVVAAEQADSLGADIINSSLGYQKFDDDRQSHTREQLNGNLAISTKAANIASELGMLVVVSAGNNGNNPLFPYVFAPADADLAITVGGVDSRELRVQSSALGPNADGQLKPDIAAKAQLTVIGTPAGTISQSNGTSFASPLIAGMLASLKSAYPNLTAAKLKEFLLASGHHHKNPDNFLGHGVPRYQTFKALEAKFSLQKEVLGNSIENPNLKVVPNPIISSQPPEIYYQGEKLKDKEEIVVIDLLGKKIFEGSVQHFKKEYKKWASAHYILKYNNQSAHLIFMK